MGGWIAPLAYSAAVSLSAGMLSFLVLLVVAKLTLEVEKAEWYGVMWFYYLLPWILIAGFLGRVSFRWYREQGTWVGTTAVFLTTVVVVTFVGAAIGSGLVWINF